jgi:hypothetical protein
MNNRISAISNDFQDRNSEAWVRLCNYVDKVADKGKDEFSPLEQLGQNLFSQIHTLPESIAKLKKVKKVWLYGSKIKRLPPEIGQMESLEYFDPYTSYDLHWFPYEITNCKKLKDSRVSTRALYGNFKNRMGFPSLNSNAVKYFGDIVHCSVCNKSLTYSETNQLWISLNVGTDVLPLLTNLCSNECESKLPKPAKGYVQNPHKGGLDLVQPNLDCWEFMDNVTVENIVIDDDKQKMDNRRKLLKLIKKIWQS